MNTSTHDSKVRQYEWAILALIAITLGGGITACGDDNASPSKDPPVIVAEGGAPGSGGSDGGTDSGGGTSLAGAPGTGGTGDTGGTGGRISEEPEREDCPDDPDGTDDEGACWEVNTCNGTASVQFLEQCSGTCIEPFDNEEHIEGFDGTLPPLN